MLPYSVAGPSNLGSPEANRRRRVPARAPHHRNPAYHERAARWNRLRPRHFAKTTVWPAFSRLFDAVAIRIVAAPLAWRHDGGRLAAGPRAGSQLRGRAPYQRSRRNITQQRLVGGDSGTRHSGRLRKRTPRPPPELAAPSLMNSIPAVSRAAMTFVRLSVTPQTVPLLASMR